MSVRATERLIGDVVTVTTLPKSPLMVVQSVDVERKIITTVWFISGNEFQEGSFPASAIDRVEAKKPQKTTRTRKTKKRG